MLKRNILLSLTFILVLTSCASLQLSEKTIPNCYKSYIATNKAIEVGYTMTIKFGQQDMLSLDNIAKAIKNLDNAANMADNASALCSLDIKAANELLAKADNLIGLSGLLVTQEVEDDK